jgi:hypothetical protein
MKAFILQSSKTATQSGSGSKKWTIEFIDQQTGKYCENYMGWTGSTNPHEQIKLKFDSLEQAIAFAVKNKIAYEIIYAHKSKNPPKSYAKNFTG